MKNNTILEKKILNDKTVFFRIYNPDIAKNAFAGNFVIVIGREGGERIPLTIEDYSDTDISIVIQNIGFSTNELSLFDEGESLYSMSGPLGKSIHVEKYGTVMFVGGGIGVAPVLPQLKVLKESGNRTIVVHGARSSDLLILQDQLKSNSDEYVICTDDGSEGEKGVVTDVMEKIFKKEKVDLVITIGPLIMMKFVALLTKKYNIKTMASLNSIMLDGTGMCGSCRVEYDGEVKFACVDGPDMDAHKIDFDTLIKRNNRFKDLEGKVM